ncbi:MAG: DUF6531 domain-containing protein [Opitutaceae bacterium]|nr:DUF6531 domain-containing protein [Opitutaceae bacterium]
MNTRVFFFALALTAGAGFAQVPYPGNDADDGVSRAADFIDPYTGNLAFSTYDIVVAGAVGQFDLTWQRHATSRASQTEPLFGLGHNWTHNWQWEMVDEGADSQGRPRVSVREPKGWVHRFTEMSPGQWWPTPGVRDRVVSEGKLFRVLRPDTSEIRFTRQNGVFTLNEIIDALGRVWMLAWEDGLLVQATEPAGRWLKINYSKLVAPTGGQNSKPFTVITSVVASDGQKVSYMYGFPAGTDYPVLSRVDYSDGTSASYSYASPRKGDRLLLVEANDSHADIKMRGRTFHYHTESEAAFGQVLNVRAAESGAIMAAIAVDLSDVRSYATREENGSTVYRRYNPGGNIAEEIDGLGFTRSYAYDAAGRGLRIALTDELGHVARFENDASGGIIKLTMPNGSIASCQRDSRGRILVSTNELGFTRTCSYDAQGRLTKIQYPDGATREFTYNTLGQLLFSRDKNGVETVRTYDDRGLLIKTTDPLGASTLISYDAQDRIAAVTDARGNVVRYSRDAGGRITRTDYPDGSNSASAYDEFGFLTKSIDAVGAVRTYAYDAFGRLITTADALGNITQLIYGSPSAGTAPMDRPVRLILPSGHIMETTYDAKDQLIAHTVAAGTKEAATIRYAYDGAGRQISFTNGRGDTVQYFYDVCGLCTKTVNAVGYEQTYAYDATGRKISESDAKGESTFWTYDALGREIAKTDAAGHVTRREYDDAGRVVSLTDGNANSYRFEYDRLGHRTAAIYPDGSRETMTYDEAGNKKSYTNRADAVCVYTYDSLNRETLSEWSDGSQRATKTYDAVGRVKVADNGLSKIIYGYDPAGRLISETQDLSPIVTGGVADPKPQTVTYAYTKSGELEAMGYPDGTTLNYRYNTLGQLQDISGNNAPPPIVTYQYDPAGNVISTLRENQTTSILKYDPDNRTTAITELASIPNQAARIDYTYDEADNRTTAKLSRTVGNTGTIRTTQDSYQYDTTYQVTSAAYNAVLNGNAVGPAETTEVYVYDAVGNRIQAITNGQTTRYSTNTLNQYIQVGSFALNYDRGGNLCTIGSWRYRYDALNRLIFAANNNIAARFYYDSRNRCIGRCIKDITTLYYYDEWNLLEETDSEGTEIARYVHGQKPDEMVLMVNPHGVFYPHRDALGNVAYLTDAGGRFFERYSYTVSGRVKIFNSSDQAIASSLAGNRWLFTGREWLAELNLYDFRNRVYSPELGRFLQTDPMRLVAKDINFYRYVFNRPTKYTDPTGLDLYALNAPGAVFGFGHEGAIVGHPGNYTYVSYGAGNNWFTASDNLVNRSFGTLDEALTFANSDRSPGNAYTNYNRFSSTAEQDSAMLTVATSWGNTSYSVFNHNCVNMDAAMGQVIGVNGSSSSIPNTWHTGTAGQAQSQGNIGTGSGSGDGGDGDTVSTQNNKPDYGGGSLGYWRAVYDWTILDWIFFGCPPAPE